MSIRTAPLTILSSVALMLLASGCMSARPAHAAPGIATSAKIAPPLAAAARQLQAGVTRFLSSGTARSDADGRLQVYVYVEQPSSPAVLAALTTHGLHAAVASPPLQLIEGWASPQDLDRIAALPGVLRITLPRYAQPHR